MTERERDSDMPDPVEAGQRGAEKPKAGSGRPGEQALPYLDLLASIASDVSDGIPVAWDQHESVPIGVKQRIEVLKALEKIADAHRAAENLIPDDLARKQRDGKRGPATTTSTTIELHSKLREPRPSAASETWGHLTILGELGQGGFGHVFRAHDSTLQRDVALKILREDRSSNRRAVKQFIDEGRRLARIRHENVLTVHGADEHDGRPGLWTDLVQGSNLKEWVQVHGPLSAAEAAQIGMVLCRALAALHSSGLVHRDIKPANVMRERGGRIILMDLGAATEQTSEEKGLVTLGTPLFMAPEQLVDENAATPQSDVYALGVTLYWLVSGQHPVEADSMYELRKRHERRELVPLRDVRADIPSAFARVVEKSLRADLDERYESVGEMEAALARCAEVRADDVGPQATVQARRRRRARWTLAAVGLPVLLVLAYLAGQPVFRSSLTVDAVLHVTRDGITRALQAGDEIRLGDALHLTLLGSRPMYIYVMNEDAAGSLTVLFPVEESVPNPLAADEEYRLPGRTKSWATTSAGGREMFLVVASEQPVVELEDALEELPHAGRGGRGVRRIIDIPDAEDGRLLPALARRYRQRARTNRGLWTWEVEIENLGDVPTEVDPR